MRRYSVFSDVYQEATGLKYHCAFWLPCTVRLKTNTKSLGVGDKVKVILGKNDEMKGVSFERSV